MGRRLAAVLLVCGALGFAGAVAAMAAGGAAAKMNHRLYVPAVVRGEDPTVAPTPTPTPRPAPYDGPVASIDLPSAGISSRFPVEQRGTVYQGGREVFADPSHPGSIAWYSDSRFGHPGFAGRNSIFAAHINYVNYGNGPFARLQNAAIDGALYITMADGTQYTYTVKRVDLVPLDSLNQAAMDAIVYPDLDEHTERVTLISCGGDFVPYAGGGGEYLSRVVLVAERWVP